MFKLALCALVAILMLVPMVKSTPAEAQGANCEQILDQMSVDPDFPFCVVHTTSYNCRNIGVIQVVWLECFD